MQDWIRTRGTLLGAIGGLVATLGDWGELWAGNAARPELHLAEAPAGVLTASTVLGVLGMFLYIPGYLACALDADRSGHRRSAGLLTVMGPLFALLSAVVHGATGVVISLTAGTSSSTDPLAGILAVGNVYVALWIAALSVFVAVGIVLLRVRADSWERILSPLPVLVVVTFGSVLLPLPWRDFIGPAGSNIAHVVFFGFLSIRRHSGDRKS